MACATRRLQVSLHDEGDDVRNDASRLVQRAGSSRHRSDYVAARDMIPICALWDGSVPDVLGGHSGSLTWR
jgi:hypothetical protein